MRALPDLKGLGPLLIVAGLVAALVLVMATIRYNGRSTEVAIEAGRLDAMMDSVSRILNVPQAPGRSLTTSYDPIEYGERSLREAVVKYNRLLPVACARASPRSEFAVRKNSTVAGVDAPWLRIGRACGRSSGKNR